MRGARGIDERIAGTRRQRPVNWGNTASVAGDQVQSLVSPDQEQSSDLLLVVQCVSFVIPPDAIGTGDWRPYVTVAWGNGGIDVEADFEVTFRQRIPLSGSKVDVRCFIRAVPLAQADGAELVTPVPAGASAVFRAFVAEGTDAEPLYPTRWVTQFGAHAGLLVGPTAAGAVLTGQQARLSTLRAWGVTSAAGGAFDYFQLFDQPTVPVNGDVPVDAWPLSLPLATGPASVATTVQPMSFGQTRAFAQGLGWALSSTPFVCTLDPDASAFVSAELLQ